MLYGHLSLAYKGGGLSALVRQGADSSTITKILQNSYYRRGISSDEVESAVKAAKNSEVFKLGTITKIEHEKFQPALDYFLFNWKSNLVITPTKAYLRGKEDIIEWLAQKFVIRETYDEIWRVDGDLGDIEKIFRAMTE